MSTWKTHADCHNIKAWIVSCRSGKGGSLVVWLWLNLGHLREVQKLEVVHL